MVHVPVLLNEVIDALDLKNGKVAVDGTLNGGGHAREIIRKIMPGGKFIGIDLDSEILSNTKIEIEKEFSEYKSDMNFVHGNYRDLLRIIQENGFPRPDAVMLDLGFSSYHIDSADRGFSFQKDEPLDMRYDQTTGRPAYEIINGMDEKSLADIIWKYGEERFSRHIAKAIVTARRKNKIKTTLELSEIVRNSVPSFYKRGRLNPATKTFQALRICVNDELGNLESFLKNIPEVMARGGRLAIISFHSLEDRIVKNSFNAYKKNKIANVITKKPIIATKKEEEGNPRSRSAKLRVLEII